MRMKVLLPTICGDERCMKCGSPLAWSGDFMRSELYGEMPESCYSVVGLYACRSCGIDYELIAFSEDEMEIAKMTEDGGDD